jgi:hypothetical protein
MNFVFIVSLHDSTPGARQTRFPQKSASHATETLRNDMNVTILSYKISFVNYFTTEK